MYSSSTEADALVGGGDNRRRSSGGASSSSSPPSKRFIYLTLAVLLAGIVTYLFFWPKSSHITPQNVIVVDQELNQRNHHNKNAGASAGADKSSVVYRPVCEYWSQNPSVVFQEGIQTSMTEPSQQWSEMACLPVHELGGESSSSDQSSGPFGFFRHNKKQQQNEAQQDNPLKLNHFQAPDALLQVNFSNRVFGDRPPIYGFGGAFTESSALNYKTLTEQGKEAVMELLFGETGLGYSIGRVHINSCDFSVESYSFDDVDGDFDLTEFDMGVHHDVESGMVDMALRATSIAKQAWQGHEELRDGEFVLYASPWSPPAWMKQPTWLDAPNATHAENMTFSSTPTCLRDGVGPESPYAAAWALYFSKFLTAYAQLGVPFWAVTVQNEPEFPAPWEACAYSPKTETDFVANHLGPRLQRDHPHVKLFVFDHNKDHINTWTNMLLNESLGARQYVDGIAYHWYAGGMDRLLDGALGIPNMHRLQDTLKRANSTQQLVLGSESCHCPSTGYSGGDLNVIWDRAERYAHTILADLMAGSNGWLEWNLLLDSIGGPNHLGNLCETTLLAAPHRAKNAAKDMPPLPPFESDKPFGDTSIGDGRTREELNALGFPAKYLDVGVVVQPIYYYMGHISRYVRPGSYAVEGLVTASTASGSTEGRIFRPKGSVVAGGGENGLARRGIELTVWPCEGSTRQQFQWEFAQQKHITVHGHDWLGRPTKSCFSRDIDHELLGLRLTGCHSKDAGVFNVLPVDVERSLYKVVLQNHPTETKPPCLVIKKLANDGGANGPRGGAQVALGDCDADESAKWAIDADFGEASSTFFGQEVCMTTGWPFLQMGAFVTPGNKKTVILLNEASDKANFALQDQNDLVMTGSIPARSIQTFVLK